MRRPEPKLGNFSVATILPHEPQTMGKRIVIKTRRLPGQPEVPTAASPPDFGPAFRTDALRAAIEKRAYELYETRGRQDSQDIDDWLAAERERLSR